MKKPHQAASSSFLNRLWEVLEAYEAFDAAVQADQVSDRVCYQIALNGGRALEELGDFLSDLAENTPTGR